MTNKDWNRDKLENSSRNKLEDKIYGENFLWRMIQSVIDLLSVANACSDFETLKKAFTRDSFRLCSWA